MDIENFNYKNIRLLPNNPRYERIKNIDLLNINYGNKYNKYEIIKTLLDKEKYDFNNFLDLVESLSIGYSFALSTIFVIKGKDNFYYVIEGNRRIMSMNIMKNLEKYEIYLEAIFKNETKYEKLLNLLKATNSNKKLNFDNLKIIEIKNFKNEDDIWRIIYSRHIAGENKGKKQWSRIKYLIDIKDMLFEYKNKFKNDNLSEIREKLAYRFNKSSNSIASDLTSSLWVTDILVFYNENTKNKNYYDFSIYGKNEISSLEISRSVIKIQTTEKNYITFGKIFQIELNNKKWEVNIKNIKKDVLYNFLITNFKEENYTTRGWKEEKEDILYDFVMPYIDVNFKTNKTLNQEIIKAERKKENERTNLETKLVKFNENVKKWKQTREILMKNKEKLNLVKLGLLKIWKDNFFPLVENFSKMRLNNYPFLIAAIIIRSSLELLSTLVLINSKEVKKELLKIWNKLSEIEKKKWNFSFSNVDKILNNFLNNNNSENVKKDVLKNYNNRKIFEIIKKFISSKKINSLKIFELLEKEKIINLDKNNVKKIKFKIGYIDNMFGGNHNITNRIIHSYYYLDNANNVELALDSVSLQLDILNRIIKNLFLK